MANNNSNQALAGQIAQNTGKLTPLAIQHQLDTWKKAHFPKLAALASTRDEAEKLFTICMNTISKTPKLLECSFDSIANCVLTSFQLKLYPGAMQECAYVPFAGVATFMPQYQGLTKLCYNSGFIKSISCNVVWEGEHFKYQEGLEPILEHIPDLDIDHNKASRVCVYCVIKTRYNDVQITVLSPRFINGIKARSKGASKSDSPWNSKFPDDVDWMWKKTALKQALKLIPKSSELADAVDHDNVIEGGVVGRPTIVDLSLNAGAAAPMAPAQPEKPQEPEQAAQTASQNNEPKALPEQTGQPINLTVPQARDPEVIPAAKPAEPSPLERAQERVRRETEGKASVENERKDLK